MHLSAVRSAVSRAGSVMIAPMTAAATHLTAVVVLIAVVVLWVIALVVLAIARRRGAAVARFVPFAVSGVFGVLTLGAIVFLVSALFAR